GAGVGFLPASSPSPSRAMAAATRRSILAGQVLPAEQVRALADLPSLDELRAKLIGMITTPASRLVGLLQAPGGQLARALAAYAEKDQQG
ncbi:MAG: hypothetical protein R3349_09550, partial [Geminicoccaceae bacterium]|nr:hypothetical protein [Geminicoccaceae bacterium]